VPRARVARSVRSSCSGAARRRTQGSRTRRTGCRCSTGRWAVRSRRRTGGRSGRRSTATASRCTSLARARTRAAALDCASRWPRCARKRPNQPPSLQP
jgi:hypothetical protein